MMVFSKFLDGLLKVWRENPFTAERAKFAEIFRILRDPLAPPATLAPHCVWCSAGGAGVSVLGGEKLGFENAMWR